MNPEPDFSLRPVEKKDREFLFAVYSSSRSEEMARVPWSAEQKAAFLEMQFTAQSQHYLTEYPRASHEIICLNGARAGRLYVDRNGETLHILDVTILPEFRNQGLGTALLGRIMAEAAQSRKTVTIYVESFNPSQRLFARLGFGRAGELVFSHLLRWSPPATTTG